MNFGNIIREGLKRAELPINSTEHLELAKSYANDNIQEIWYRLKADWRQSRDSITTAIGSDEYLLNKLFDGFVRNSLRGDEDNPRTLKYKATDQFFRRTAYGQSQTGQPYLYTFGDMTGYDSQIASGTSPTITSSLANKTSNDVNVTAGSRTVTADADTFSLNDIGLRFERQGDTITYQIGRFHDARKIELTTKYRGITGSNVSYAIGDIGIHVNVQGFVGGQIDSEDVQLNGTAKQQMLKTFTVITSISKSELTGGRVIVQDSTETFTIGTMAPGETEIERQTVKLFPIPDSAETLQYRFYMRHPVLRLDSDRCLIPQKYHRIIGDMTTANLLTWADRPVAQRIEAGIASGLSQIDNDANNSELENNIPQNVGSGESDGLFENDLDQDFLN